MATGETKGKKERKLNDFPNFLFQVKGKNQQELITSFLLFSQFQGTG